MHSGAINWSYFWINCIMQVCTRVYKWKLWFHEKNRDKGAFTYDIRCFGDIFDLLTYPNQILYYIGSLFSKIRCLPTYLKIWRHKWMLPKQHFQCVRKKVNELKLYFCFLIGSKENYWLSRIALMTKYAVKFRKSKLMWTSTGLKVSKFQK